MSTATPAAPHCDNLLGICHAIGRAFGINPLWLRLSFMLAMLVNFPLATLAYALSGLAVLASIVVDKAMAPLARRTLASA